jgi:hypothetical protein
VIQAFSRKLNDYFPLHRSRELEAKLQKVSSLFSEHQTLASQASDAGVSVWWLTLGGALLVSLHQMY